MNQQTPSSKPAHSAFGWNVAVIVVGAIITVCGILAWAVASPQNSAFQQTVAALWLIQAFIGLLIAAIGVLGATLVSVLNTPMKPRAEAEVLVQPPSNQEGEPLHPAESAVPDGLQFTDAPHQLNAASVRILENAKREDYIIESRHDRILLYRYGVLLRVCRSNDDIKTFGTRNDLVD